MAVRWSDNWWQHGALKYASASWAHMASTCPMASYITAAETFDSGSVKSLLLSDDPYIKLNTWYFPHTSPLPRNTNVRIWCTTRNKQARSKNLSESSLNHRPATLFSLQQSCQAGHTGATLILLEHQTSHIVIVSVVRVAHAPAALSVTVLWKRL